MRNLSKFALSILSTLVVSSVLAQCPAGGPCPYQQSGGYGSYGGGYGGNYSYSSPNYDSTQGYGYSSGTRERTARGHYRNVAPSYSSSYGSDNYDGNAPMYYQDQMGHPGYQGDMEMQGDMYGRPGAMRGMHDGMQGQPNQGSMYYDQSGSRGMYNPQGSSNAGYSQGTAQQNSSTGSQSSNTSATPSTTK